MNFQLGWIEPCLRWVCFNVIIALTPIILSIAVIKVFNLSASWTRVLKEGELYIFSTTTASSSVGVLLFQKSTSPTSQTFITIASFALILVIILSSAMFAVSSFLKWKGQDEPNIEKTFGKTSVSLALLAVILGLFAFIQGGMK